MVPKIRLQTFLLLAAAFSLQTGCALFEPDYQSIDTDDDYQSYSARKDGTLEAYEELGMTSASKLSSQERDAVLTKSRLIRLERSLVTTKEREQYYNYRPYLPDDGEKITFLELPTVEARDKYAMAKGIYFKNPKFSPDVREAVQNSDIILGMPKEAVIQSWGEPEVMEVAGSALYGNERWKYVEFVTTQEGYQREERIVYFQNGKVAGWERQ
jgi:hypothetical protein